MIARTLAVLALTVAPAAFAAAAPAARDDAALDVAADRKRDELIEDLRTIIPRMPDGDRRADLYFQLAELFWEKSRYAAFQEVKEHDAAVARAPAGEEPKVDTRKSEDYRRQAVELYRQILDRYPAYERRDEVLFVGGHNLYDSGDKQQGVAWYQALIAQYPRSRFLPDAHVQLGEHWFASNDLRHARAAFEQAASYHLPKIYPFAIYKLAWCDYNAGNYRSSVARFQEVIAYAAGENSGDRVQLKQEALRDIVLAYARLDSIESAVAWLTGNGGASALDSIQRLADTYFDDGKFEQSILVYRILQERAQGHARAPVWQQKILLAYDKLNRRDQVVTEMKRLVSDYGPQSGWARANTQQQAAVAEASELAEGALRELVQDYHQEAIKTKSAATYRLARDIYRQYLDAFPRSEAAPSMRFYYAEILYALEEWDAAATEYGAVVDAAPQGQHAQRAAYNAILALEKSVAIARGQLKRRELADGARVEERKDKGQVERKTLAKTASPAAPEESIPENERKLIAACDRYLRLSPGSKEEIVIRYKAAFALYERRHFLEAAGRFGEIILRWPTDPWSQKAADLSLDILNTKGEWLALNELAHRFLEDKKLCPPGSKFQAEVAKIAEGARFKYVMDLYQHKQEAAAAAKEFRAFVARYPRSEHAPKALYNAMVIADKADELDVAIAAGEQLLRDYPGADPSLLKLTVPALASASERAARYENAIRSYELAQTRWPGEAKAADWLYNAAVWREGLGDDAGAARLWETWLRQYRSRPEAARVAFNLGLLLERQKQTRKAADHWAAFQREWGRIASADQLFLARYRQGIALRQLKAPEAGGVLADAMQRFARLPEKLKASAPVLDAAAHARFLAAEPAFGEFLGVGFKSTRQADLVAALKAKNARLQRLLSSYAEVVAVGSPRWSQAAFARIGEAYRNFNKGLLDAPVPRGLDPEQQELYRSTLESQALPLEDKSTEALRKAIAVAEKSGVYCEWTLKAQNLLTDYQPDAYGEPRLARFAESGLSRPVPPDLDGAVRGGGQGGGGRQ